MNTAYGIHCRYSIESRAAAAGLDLHTTIEMLEVSGRMGYNLVFPYHDYVIYAWDPCNGERLESASVAVYRFDDQNHHQDISFPVSLVYLSYKEFSDIGDAVSSGLLRAQALKAQELMRKKV